MEIFGILQQKLHYFRKLLNEFTRKSIRLKYSVSPKDDESSVQNFFVNTRMKYGNIWYFIIKIDLFFRTTQPI